MTPSRHPIIDEAEEIAGRDSLFSRLMSISLEALSSRALVWLVTLGAGALWTLAMLEPTWLKIAVATGYCLTVLLPILHRDAKGG